MPDGRRFELNLIRRWVAELTNKSHLARFVSHRRRSDCRIEISLLPGTGSQTFHLDRPVDSTSSPHLPAVARPWDGYSPATPLQEAETLGLLICEHYYQAPNKLSENSLIDDRSYMEVSHADIILASRIVCWLKMLSVSRSIFFSTGCPAATTWPWIAPAKHGQTSDQLGIRPDRRCASGVKSRERDSCLWPQRPRQAISLT